ncbi:MAG: hypothetical protein JW751_25185 [Polyangiaceae bacterium]|nr:hypothetical protein [Polyangiaceae bacterium]
MAVTRRQFLIIVPTCAAAVGCAGAVRRQIAGPAYVELHQQGGRANAGTVLVCMPETPQTQEVWVGLTDELGTEFRMVAIRVADRSSGPAIAEGIRRHRPSAIVLMNNPTVAAYRDYLGKVTSERRLPAVVVMTSFLEPSELLSLGATGITYEVPLITAVTSLRRIVASPVDRVGVVCRAPLAGFVARQRDLALREQVAIVEENVRSRPNASELRRAIRRAKNEADALWLLNDDRLLTPNLIADGWLPGLNERPWRPTIVGAASLVSSQQSFGTFAVLPDHTALGVQTANLVFEIADNGWKLPADLAAQLPLSTTVAIDSIQARERFALQEDAFAQVDRIVE